MADDGFHEIELKGKQLVFLFMAATVVAVVIFLCGVMVGRGVRTPAVSAAPELAAAEAVDPTTTVTSVPLTPTGGAPPSTQETLTYTDRLEADRPVTEKLREPVAAASNVPDVPAEPIPNTPAASAARPETMTSGSVAEPPGNGYVVQVMAARTRAEADRLAKGLGAKGYPAFVTMAAGATPTPYRVRVGKYNNLREAEAMAKRLKDKEQFNTWITR